MDAAARHGHGHGHGHGAALPAHRRHRRSRSRSRHHHAWYHALAALPLDALFWALGEIAAVDWDTSLSAGSYWVAVALNVFYASAKFYPQT
ncbi:hypothetical protein CXG81DRAFT_25865, partial [Caulochytrium protostelioides]